jgi:hypothetical protein
MTPTLLGLPLLILPWPFPLSSLEWTVFLISALFYVVWRTVR